MSVLRAREEAYPDIPPWLAAQARAIGDTAPSWAERQGVAARVAAVIAGIPDIPVASLAAA
jgi:hypothetical protein